MLLIAGTRISYPGDFMAMFSKGPRPAIEFGTNQAVENAATGNAGGHSGLGATAISAVALFFSGLSYYDSSLKSADITVYVPPMVHYARDGADVFNLPITIANDGARAGTVLSMILDVENLDPKAERKSMRFRSAFLGDYPRDDKAPLRSFAPMSVPGHGTVTETVRFYNMGEMLPMLVVDKGDFRFTLTLNTAKAAGGFLDDWMRKEPKPLKFDLSLPYFAVQHVAFQNGTLAMYNKDWQPAVSTPDASESQDGKN